LETRRKDPLGEVMEDLERIRGKLDMERRVVRNVCRLLGGIDVSELGEKVEDLIQEKESRKWEDRIKELTDKNGELQR